MTERPILFSGEMVRAILDGRKTQTRRLVTLPKRRSLKGEGMDWVKSIHQDGGGNWVAWSTDAPDTAAFTKQAYPNGEGFPCPYGKPGDRLWVRETWQMVYEDKGGNRTTQPNMMKTYVGAWYEYAATSTQPPPRWRPSIFMPRKACRLTLEVVSVRAERLWAITEDGIQAEGLRAGVSGVSAGYLRDIFETLWNKINGKRAPWASNPFVWVLEFKPVSP